MKITVRHIAATVWCVGILCATLISRGSAQGKRSASEDEAPGASSRPAWISGFTAEFESVDLANGSNGRPGAARDASGWSTVGYEKDASAPKIRDVEIPPWVDLTSSTSIAPRQPKAAERCQQADCECEEATAIGDCPSVCDQVSVPRRITPIEPAQVPAPVSAPVALPEDSARRERIESGLSTLKTLKSASPGIQKSRPAALKPMTARPAPQAVASAPQAQPNTPTRIEEAAGQAHLDTAAEESVPAEEANVVSSDAARIARMEASIASLRMQAEELSHAAADRTARAQANASAGLTTLRSAGPVQPKNAEHPEAPEKTDDSAIPGEPEKTGDPVEVPSDRIEEVAPAPAAESVAEPDSERLSRIQSGLKAVVAQKQSAAETTRKPAAPAVLRPMQPGKISDGNDSGWDEPRSAKQVQNQVPAEVQEPSGEDAEESAIEPAAEPDEALLRISRLEAELSSLKTEERPVRAPAHAASRSLPGAQTDVGSSNAPRHSTVNRPAAIHQPDSEAYLVPKRQADPSHAAIAQPPKAKPEIDPTAVLRQARLARLEAELAAMHTEKQKGAYCPTVATEARPDVILSTPSPVHVSPRRKPGKDSIPATPAAHQSNEEVAEPRQQQDIRSQPMTEAPAVVPPAKNVRLASEIERVRQQLDARSQNVSQPAPKPVAAPVKTSPPTPVRPPAAPAPNKRPPESNSSKSRKGVLFPKGSWPLGLGGNQQTPSPAATAHTPGRTGSVGNSTVRGPTSISAPQRIGGQSQPSIGTTASQVAERAETTLFKQSSAPIYPQILRTTSEFNEEFSLADDLEATGGIVQVNAEDQAISELQLNQPWRTRIANGAPQSSQARSSDAFGARNEHPETEEPPVSGESAELAPPPPPLPSEDPQSASRMLEPNRQRRSVRQPQQTTVTKPQTFATPWSGLRPMAAAETRHTAIFANFDAAFVQPHFANSDALNVRQGTAGNTHSTTRNFDFGFDLTPRASFGIVDENGLGLRAGSWLYDEGVSATSGVVGVNGVTGIATATIAPFDYAVGGSDPLPSLTTDVAGDRMQASHSLKLTTYDAEVIQRIALRRSQGTLAAGVRYLHMEQKYDVALINGAGGVDGYLLHHHTFEGFGPTVAAEWRLPFGDAGLSVYANARGSVIFGERDQTARGYDGAAVATQYRKDRRGEIGIGEGGVGLQYEGDFAVIRLGYEGQLWTDAGTASTLLGSLGLQGLLASVGFIY